jgi:hypothetical protein
MAAGSSIASKAISIVARNEKNSAVSSKGRMI